MPPVIIRIFRLHISREKTHDGHQRVDDRQVEVLRCRLHEFAEHGRQRWHFIGVLFLVAHHVLLQGIRLPFTSDPKAAIPKPEIKLLVNPRKRICLRDTHNLAPALFVRMSELRQDGKQPLPVVRGDITEVFYHLVVIVVYLSCVRCTTVLYPFFHDVYQRCAAEFHLFELLYLLF